MTALMLASELCEDKYADTSSYLPIINILLQAGANINMYNNDKYTALILAAGEGNSSAVETLLQSTTNTTTATTTNTNNNNNNNNNNSNKIDIEAKNKFGKTALILACEFGHEDVVRVLLGACIIEYILYI